MLRLVAGIEANGFLEEATVIHCIVCKDIDTGQVYQFYSDTTVPGHHGSIQCGLEFMLGADVLVGHNFVGYDLPVIAKLHGYQYVGQLFDSLVLSRTLNPERRRPPNCPPSVLNPITKRKDVIQPHSLAAWGYRVGGGKVETL